MSEYELYVRTKYKGRFVVQPVRWFFTITGFLFMGFLMLMRHNFLWWPLHPLGFPLAAVETTQRLWFSVFIGWFIKLLILKYGGIKLFNRLLPWRMANSRGGTDGLDSTVRST